MRRPHQSTLRIVLVVMTPWLTACVSESPDYAGQRAFQEPQEAVRAFAAAVERDDAAAMSEIFGPEAADLLSSGDPVADKSNRAVVAVALREKWTFDRTSGISGEVVIGHEAWPFPIPLTRDSRGWWFNTRAGRDEVLARRIGRNELAAIGALRGYVAAQREYAANGYAGRPGVYAMRIRSEPGTHNGLYWPVRSPDEPRSPLNDFAASAFSEGYGQGAGPAAYRGYNFRVLTRQGPGASGGAEDYVVSGEMTQGFAMIASPATYANSGVMTFIVGPDGRIFERDLGPETDAAASRIAEFDPSQDWSEVK